MNSPLRVTGAEIFFNERFGRPRLRERTCVSERSMQRARSSRNLFIEYPRYTLDVTSPRTIRKNTNRRESYEGEGISSSPTAIARARVRTRHDIPALRQPLAILPPLVAKSDHLLPETRELSARKAIATRIRLYPRQARTYTRKICIEQFVKNMHSRLEVDRSDSEIRDLVRKFVQMCNQLRTFTARFWASYYR